MRRTLIVALATALLSITVSAPSSAAIKAGSKCILKDEKKTSGNKVFTCTKSGGKLLWSKGEALKPKSAKKASASSSTTSGNSPKGEQAPTGEISFANLAANYSGVPYWAWKKSSEKIAKSQPADVKITVLTGPNTTLNNTKPEEGVLLASRMYADFPQASEFVLIYFNYQDIAWAEKYLDQYIGNDGGYDTSGEVKKMCPSADRCSSAAALLNRRTGIGVTIVTSSESQKNDSNFTSGTLEAHEYSHTIQNKQVVGRIPNNRQAPRWLLEGGAEFIQLASVYFESFSKYKSNRSAVVSGLYITKTFNKVWLNDFLNPSTLGISWENWNKYDGWRVYDVGFMVSEILVSIGGPNSIMEIFKLMGDGLTYQEAFAKVFGISWDAGIETITKVLAKEIGN
jgi:hypothetical protein